MLELNRNTIVLMICSTQLLLYHLRLCLFHISGNFSNNSKQTHTVFFLFFINLQAREGTVGLSWCKGRWLQLCVKFREISLTTHDWLDVLEQGCVVDASVNITELKRWEVRDNMKINGRTLLSKSKNVPSVHKVTKVHISTEDLS